MTACISSCGCVPSCGILLPPPRIIFLPIYEVPETGAISMLCFALLGLGVALLLLRQARKRARRIG